MSNVHRMDCAFVGAHSGEGQREHQQRQKKVPVWKEKTGMPGYYWNTTGKEYFKGQLYQHKFEDGIHTMVPTGIKF